MSSPLVLGSQSPGQYAHPVHAPEAPRARPMFAPGTVWHAAELADFKELEKLIAAGKDNGYHESVVLQQKEDLLGMMPIHVASEKGHVELVQYLIKKRVDLDAGDKYRVTALHLAAIENHEEVVRLLLAARADVKPADLEGDLPIHWAATRGHVAVLQLLIKHGSPVDPINKLTWTPLHRAAYNGRKEACVALANAGASLSARNKDGNTPLHLAAFMNQLSTLDALLGLSARTDAVNVAGKYPLDLCITDAARELIGKHATKFAPPPPKPAAGTPAQGSVDVERERGSARMDTSKLTEARSKQKAAEEFPDLDEGARRSGGKAKGVQEAQEESTLYMRAGSGGQGASGGLRSDFLSEASGGFDNRHNPYTMGYQNLGGGGGGQNAEERTSGSLRERPSFTSGRLVTRQSSLGPERSSAGSQAVRTSDAAHLKGRTSGHLDAAAARRAALQERPSATREGASLAGGRSSVTVPASQSGGLAGWEGADRLSAAEHQQRVKEENRRSAAAGAAGTLLGDAGSSLAAKDASKAAPRPVSGNKKFLSKYSLEKMGLFAP